MLIQNLGGGGGSWGGGVENHGNLETHQKFLIYVTKFARVAGVCRKKHLASRLTSEYKYMKWSYI